MVVAGAGPLLHYRGHAEMNEEVREAILDWLSGPPVADPLDPEFRTVSADALIAFLEKQGFKIVRDPKWTN